MIIVQTYSLGDRIKNMTSIILAAGLSTRMGRNKLLLPYNGSTIIETTVMNVAPFSDRIIVVVGHEREKMEKLLSGYDICLVFNPDYIKGQRSSTIRGIENVVDDDFIVLPGDLPLITHEDISGTIDLLSTHMTARAMFKDTPGHPVAYRKENRERLISFPGSMKEYLRSTDIGFFNASIGAVFDVDTPARYEMLLSGDMDPSVLD